VSPGSIRGAARGVTRATAANPVEVENVMKAPKPELQNTRVIRLATRVISLPFRLPGTVYRFVKALFQGLKSEERRRSEDQLRQSRARRTLRGLPADHVQSGPKPL
jgi:hypothetical protein